MSKYFLQLNFNLKWLNFITISSTSIIPILSRVINKKWKCYQLINGIYVTQFHFVTYWVWIIVHHYGPCHAKSRNMFPRGQKIPISSSMYVFSHLNTRKGIQEEIWKTFASTSNSGTLKEMIKGTKNNKIRVFALLVFYENRKSIV